MSGVHTAAPWAARRGAAWLGLLALVAAVYGRSLDDPFQFDDHHAIVDNHNLRSLDRVPRFFVDPGTFSADSTLAMYRPLLLTTFALNHAVSGARPWSWHLANLLVHAAVAVAVYEALRAHVEAGVALLGAALFAAHPVHSEAVYYVSSRSESLAALCVLVALNLHARLGPGVGRWRAGAAVAAFAAGLLTKSTAIALVPLAWLHDLLVEPGSWRRRWPAHLGYAAVAGAYLAFTRDLVARATLAAPVRGYGEQVWSQVKGLVAYAQLLAVPRGLSVDHQFQLSASLADPYAAAAACLVGSVVVVAAAGGRRWPHALYLVGWFLVALAPASLVPLNVIVNEHRLYLAGVAVAAGIAGLSWAGTFGGRGARPGEARRQARQARVCGTRVAWAGAWAAVPLLAGLACLRGAAWDDPVALWADAVRKGPDMARPRLQLAQAQARAGRHAEAVPLFVSGLARDPGFVAGYGALAASQAALGRRDDAVATARGATQVAPDDAEAWALLAEVCRGRAAAADTDSAAAWYQASADAYEEALARAPEAAAYHDNLGNTYQVLGRLEAALRHHRRAVELAPGSAASHLNLGNALWLSGDEGQAEAAWRAAVAIDPAYAPAWASLEALYARRGDEVRAAQARAHRLEPSP